MLIDLHHVPTHCTTFSINWYHTVHLNIPSRYLPGKISLKRLVAPAAVSVP